MHIDIDSNLLLSIVSQTYVWPAVYINTDKRARVRWFDHKLTPDIAKSIENRFCKASATKTTDCMQNLLYQMLAECQQKCYRICWHNFTSDQWQKSSRIGSEQSTDGDKIRARSRNAAWYQIGGKNRTKSTFPSHLNGIAMYLKTLNIWFDSSFAYRYAYFLVFKFLLEVDIKPTKYGH